MFYTLKNGYIPTELYCCKFLFLLQFKTNKPSCDKCSYQQYRKVHSNYFYNITDLLRVINMYCFKIPVHFTLYYHIINSRISVISFMFVSLLLLLLGCLPDDTFCPLIFSNSLFSAKLLLLETFLRNKRAYVISGWVCWLLFSSKLHSTKYCRSNWYICLQRGIAESCISEVNHR